MTDPKLREPSGAILVAHCDVHGTHGVRDRCFICEKPVRQIPMMPVSEHEKALERAQGYLRRFVEAWDDHDDNDLFTTYRFAKRYLDGLGQKRVCDDP